MLELEAARCALPSASRTALPFVPSCLRGVEGESGCTFTRLDLAPHFKVSLAARRAVEVDAGEGMDVPRNKKSVTPCAGLTGAHFELVLRSPEGLISVAGPGLLIVGRFASGFAWRLGGRWRLYA